MSDWIEFVRHTNMTSPKKTTHTECSRTVPFILHGQTLMSLAVDDCLDDDDVISSIGASIKLLVLLYQVTGEISAVLR